MKLRRTGTKKNSAIFWTTLYMCDKPGYAMYTSMYMESSGDKRRNKSVKIITHNYFNRLYIAE